MSDHALRVLVDLGCLERNLKRFHHRASASGVLVRAHAKGHRTVEIALRQMRAGACGIAVTQIAQARRYVAAGITDVVIAHPWQEPWRWRLIAQLARDCRLSVHIDSREAVAGLAAAAVEAGSVVGVRVQLGTGTDVTATADDELLALAHAAATEPALRLDGVTGYQSLLTVESAAVREDIGRATAEYAVRIAGLLREEGLPCPVVTVGGTPTADGAMAVPGVTEVCAGAYALQDAGMAAIGVCGPEDVAVSVIASEPSHADTVLAAYPYPWQTPAEHTELGSSAGRHTPIVPPHICALLMQIDAVTAYEQEWPDSTWRVLNHRDEADPTAMPPPG
jgi:D-serine deaminase-like pyridoxal phosphate-dependent protein